MPTLLDGHLTWEGSRDENGYRTYHIEWIAELLPTEGPAAAMQTPGLPLPGSYWAPDADIDVYVWCRPDLEVRPHPDYKPGDPTRWWVIEQTFSNKPLPPASHNGGGRSVQGCKDTPLDDPLLDPQQVSGGFTKYTEEATYDRYGEAILNSAFEKITGPQAEWDANRPTVKISQNVPLLQIELFAAMVDTLNQYPLWGLPARCVKLSSVSWERKFHGLCSIYYSRTFEFDIRYDTFDRTFLDEGTKVLNGYWGAGDRGTTGTGDDETSGWQLMPVWVPGVGYQPPDPTNPAHFIRAKDRNGENMRVVLNGAGVPYDPAGTTPGTDDDAAGRIFVQKYGESDFLLLGIPAFL